MARFNKELKKRQPEKPSYYEQKIQDDVQNLHYELFPEEYDFMLDSNADLADRNRGINPMSKKYQEEVAERRRTMGVAPLGKKGSNGMKGSYEYCMDVVRENAKIAPEFYHQAVRNIFKALHFAAEKHVDQRRKGEKNEPYFNHVSEVAYTNPRQAEWDDVQCHFLMESISISYSIWSKIFLSVFR